MTVGFFLHLAGLIEEVWDRTETEFGEVDVTCLKRGIAVSAGLWSNLKVFHLSFGVLPFVDVFATLAFGGFACHLWPEEGSEVHADGLSAICRVHLLQRNGTDAIVLLAFGREERRRVYEHVLGQEDAHSGSVGRTFLWSNTLSKNSSETVQRMLPDCRQSSGKRELSRISRLGSVVALTLIVGLVETSHHLSLVPAWIWNLVF